MSSVDLGNQNITFRYKEYTAGNEFNKQLREVLKSGIYKGGLLSKESNSSILLSTFDAWFNVDVDIACHISTSTIISLTVTEAQPILYMTYSWFNAITNFIDFGFKAVGDPPVTNEIIVGKVNFTGGVVDGTFDYSSRAVGLIDDSGNTYVTNTLKFDGINDCNMYKSSSNVIYTSSYMKAKRFLPTIVNVTTATQQMNAGYLYYINYSGGICNLTLPTDGEVGALIKIRDIRNYGWKVNQNAGQSILLPNGRYTVLGTSGEIHSRIGGASTDLTCITTNTTWKVLNLQDEWPLCGFVLAGQSNYVDRFNFQNETCNMAIATLSASTRYYSAGISSSRKGYTAGGYGAGGSGDRLNSIESIFFVTEALSTLASTLTANKGNMDAISNNIKGYIMGGYIGSIGTTAIDALNLTTDIVTSNANSLNVVKFANRCIQSNLKGYSMGGDWDTYPPASYCNTIEGFPFATETASILANTLTREIISGGCVSSNLKGYLMGGYVSVGGARNTIEGVSFITETASLLTETLTYTCAVNFGLYSNLKGYNAGYTGYQYIEDLNFATETSNMLTAYVSGTDGAQTGVQSYTG